MPFVRLLLCFLISAICSTTLTYADSETNGYPNGNTPAPTHTIHVLGAVEQQGPVEFTNTQLNAPLAEVITRSISEAGGFKDFAKSSRIYVYFKTGDQQDGFEYNAQCTFRFNTHASQKDDDCKLAAQHPDSIYRVFIKGSKRKSIWGYTTDALQLFGAIAVPVILASDG